MIESIICRLSKIGFISLLVSIPIVPALADNHLVDTKARNLAASCAQCHGTNGQPVNQDNGVLAGMDKDELLELITDFRNDVQPSPIMGQIAKGYTQEQIQIIAEYFSKIK